MPRDISETNEARLCRSTGTEVKVHTCVLKTWPWERWDTQMTSVTPGKTTTFVGFMWVYDCFDMVLYGFICFYMFLYGFYMVSYGFIYSFINALYEPIQYVVLFRSYLVLQCFIWFYSYIIYDIK